MRDDLQKALKMYDLRLTKRYVFDLNEVVAGVQHMATFSVADKTLARAWIVNHLYKMHYLDVQLIPDLPWVEEYAVIQMGRQGGRYMHGLESSLWRLFREMSQHVCNSQFFNITFNHDILAVDVYN